MFAKAGSYSQPYAELACTLAGIQYGETNGQQFNNRVVALGVYSPHPPLRNPNVKKLRRRFCLPSAKKPPRPARLSCAGTP